MKRLTLALVAMIIALLLVTGSTLALQTDTEPQSFTELAEANGIPSSVAPVQAEPQSFTELAEALNAQQVASQIPLSSAALTFYTDSTAFGAVCPNLPVENFENPNTGPNSVLNCPGPLDNATGGGGCYPSGELISGFSLAPSFNNVAVLTPSAFGVISTVAGPNFFAANTTITFAPNVSGVGFDLVDVFGDNTWKIEVFGSSGSLGSTTATGSVGGSFVGVSSNAGPISKIEITGVSGENQGELVDNLTFGNCILEVEIDIKPGSDPNSINCNNEDGIIAVAILTTDDFDATTVDHTTVTFEGASETHVDKKTGLARRHEEDVDDDGDTDLLFHFRQGETNLTCTSTEGMLTGQTFGGQAIEGTDAVRMIDNN